MDTDYDQAVAYFRQRPQDVKAIQYGERAGFFAGPHAATIVRAAVSDLPCTCDYSGLEGEPHKPFCEKENGPHAECMVRADVTREAGDALAAAAERVRLVNGALVGIDDLTTAVEAWRAVQ